jgi:chitinase
VTYTTREATATADNDYIPARGSMVFAPGQTTATFTVMVRDDEQVEDDESISLALEGVVNATLGEPDQATLVIRDNDEPQPVPEVRFSATDYVVAEDGGTALISITLSAARTQPVTVTYRTQDGSATAGADYTAVSESLTFAPGQTTATFMVTVRDDDKVEGDETVELVLVTVENASISEGRGRATLTIADNDQPLPQVSFSAVSYAVDEDSDTAYITTTLSAASTRPITVTYATQDDSATAGTDYITASGRLDFAPGQTTATFMVTVRDDDKVEGDETVELVLVAAENATLGEQNTAMLIILDNEQEPEPEALRLDRARGSGQTASFWPLAARNICRASSVLPHCYRYG